jgi:hypothetical protein
LRKAIIDTVREPILVLDQDLRVPQLAASFHFKPNGHVA